MKTSALDSLSLVLLIAACAVTLLTPPITAVVATILTSRDVHSEPYELVRLTTLPEAAIVWGYVFAALYRMRSLIALTVGLMPALAVGVFQGGLAVHTIFYTFYSFPGTQPSPVELPDIGNIIEVSLVFVVLAIGLWGMNLLAAATGVGLAFRSRGTIIANAVAVLITLLAVLSLPLLALLANSPNSNVMATLCLSAIPYLLGLGLIYWTKRWMETHPD